MVVTGVMGGAGAGGAAGGPARGVSGVPDAQAVAWSIVGAGSAARLA